MVPRHNGHMDSLLKVGNHEAFFSPAKKLCLAYLKNI